MNFFKSRAMRATKPYVCFEADCAIAPGERYHRVAYHQEGYFAAHTFCNDCHELRRRAWDALDWEIEDAPAYGDLHAELKADWDIPDPAAWLAEQRAMSA